MSTHALTDAEAATLSSLNFVDAPPEPGLRLVYSRSNVEDLVGAIARTRRELRAAEGRSLECQQDAQEAARAAAHLRELEQRQVVALDTYINALARMA